VKLLFDADAEDHYAKRPKAGLMQAVYDWSRGEAFATILAQNGNISEGFSRDFQTFSSIFSHFRVNCRLPSKH
jgi:hypothetical protein